MKIWFCLLLVITKSQDVTHTLSDRSLNLIFDLLANTREFLNGQCFKNFKDIHIDFFFSFILRIEFLCIQDIDIQRIQPSIKFIDESTLHFQFPRITLKGTSRIRVIDGPLPSFGDVDFSIEEVDFSGLMTFSKFGADVRMNLDGMLIEYGDIQLDIENLFLEALWQILLDHDFVKNYIIENTLDDLSEKASKLKLNKLVEFDLHGKRYVFGMKDKPTFRQSDQFFLTHNFFFEEENSQPSTQTDDQPLSNLQLGLKADTLGHLLKLFEEKLVIDLDSIPAIKDKLTVQFLSVLFPGLSKLYPNDPDKHINLKIYFKLNEAPIQQRDYNLFLFANILLEMKVNEGKEKLCSL